MLGQMLADLKLASNVLPAAPNLSPTDMIYIGSYDFAPETLTSSEDLRMGALAAHQPLADFLLGLHQFTPPTPILETYTRRLIAQAPHNLEVRAEELSIWNDFTPAFQQEFGRSMPSSPNNYAVATWKYVSSQTIQEHVTRGEQLPRCAPRDPAAWLTLSRQYSTASEKVRRSRPVSMITGTEWNILNRIYARWLSTARKATDLDSEYGLAWIEVATAAAFVGQGSLADEALWKAIRLEPDNARVYT